MSTVKTLSQALGAIAGGFLLVVTTPAMVFGGAAAFMLAAAAATKQFGRIPIRVSGTGASTGMRGVLRDTVGVIRLPYVGGLLVVSGLRTFVRGMWIAVAVIASLRLLHAGGAGVGLLMLAAGVGALAAVPLSAALIGRRQIGGPTILAFVACGIPLVIIAGIPLFDTALFFVAAWGVGMAVADVATFSLLHRLLDTPLLPRVTGAIESAKLALEGLGALVGPLLASTVGIRWALAAGRPASARGRRGGAEAAATGWTLQRANARRFSHCSTPCRSWSRSTWQPSSPSSGRLTHIDVPTGTDVVRQGDKGDRFYIVRAGSAEVLVDGFLVGSVTPGGYFGERALLRDVPRMATVRSRRTDGPAHLATGRLRHCVDRPGGRGNLAC